MLHKHSTIKAIVIGCALSLTVAFSSFASSSIVKSQAKVSLAVDDMYLPGKVNDPVTKQTKPAFIVSDNASFRLTSEDGSVTTADVIVYVNEYLNGQDVGVRNRVLKKTVKIGESLNLLPENLFEQDTESGKAYDFVNRCYDVRVFTDASKKNYQDFYFGMVTDAVLEELSENLEQ